jgi:hypothetical protein
MPDRRPAGQGILTAALPAPHQAPQLRGQGMRRDRGKGEEGEEAEEREVPQAA